MLYERIYMGPDTDPVEIEPRPLVFEDVAAQATALLGDVGGELRSVGEAKTGQEFRLVTGNHQMWIWRPMNTAGTDEEVSLGFFVTPLEALTLLMAVARYTDDKLNPELADMPDEDKRSRRLADRLYKIVNQQFGGASERKSMLQADTPHFEKVQTFERLPDEAAEG